MKRGYLILLISFVACSSEPPAQSKAPITPDWTHQPPRVLNESDSTLIYVGIGEDRVEQNARFKSEAIALQDLANDCSFIPKETVIQEDHFEQSIGLIFRAYARVTVNLKDCSLAQEALTPTQIRNQANPQFEAEVSSYQKSYDPPEKEERAPLSANEVIADSPHYFIARQQLSLAKQSLVLSPDKSVNLDELAGVSREVSTFKNANPQVWMSAAFSSSRPNWTAHQPSAVRETVAERALLKQEYNYTPTPVISSPKKGSGFRGRGRRQSVPVPQQSQPDPAPSPPLEN